MSWIECQRCDCWRIGIFSDPQPGVIRHKNTTPAFYCTVLCFLIFLFPTIRTFGVFMTINIKETCMDVLIFHGTMVALQHAR